MNIWRMDDDGCWEIPDGEKDSRRESSYQVNDLFPFPIEVSRDLRKAIKGFSWDSFYVDELKLADIPSYVLGSFGLYRENYPDDSAWKEAVFDFINEKSGRAGFLESYNHVSYDTQTKLTEVACTNINLPLFSRILATILAHHGVNEVFTIEAARLYKDPEYSEKGAYGGEVWAIGPGCVSFLSTGDMRNQLAENLQQGLDARDSARMAP